MIEINRDALMHDIRNAVVALASCVKDIEHGALKQEARFQLRRIERALTEYEKGKK